MDEYSESIAMSTSYITDTMMTKFNKLKQDYANKAAENPANPDEKQGFNEEDLNELEVKSAMDKINGMMTHKLAELKTVQEKIAKLTQYKTEVTDILSNMARTQDKCSKLYLSLSLCMGANTVGLNVESPMSMTYVHLATFDLRRDASGSEVIDPFQLRERLVIVKDTYVNSLCDLYDEIGEKLEDATSQMQKIHDFLNRYKETVGMCGGAHNSTLLSEYNCTICYEDPVTMYIQPCGHTFCTKCTEKLTTRCFICNRPVTAKSKMFLLGREEEDAAAPPGAAPVRASATGAPVRVNTGRAPLQRVDIASTTLAINSWNGLFGSVGSGLIASEYR